MGIIAWIVFGLIAGVIAKLLMPGRDGGGFILTCILGIVGAVVGGWLATMFGIGGSISGFNLHSFLVAVVGAIVVLDGVFVGVALNDAGRVDGTLSHGFSCGQIRSSIFSVTPLVQPKPS